MFNFKLSEFLWYDSTDCCRKNDVLHMNITTYKNISKKKTFLLLFKLTRN